jgi:endonuclease/exonuclease/phosphatase family metal-dependent hydrolase
VVGKGKPVFLVGDFNERERAFCEVTGKLGMVAPRGGSHQGGDCNPPSGKVRIDWIFGTKDVEFSGYREDRSPLVKLITDHAVLRAKVRVS